MDAKSLSAGTCHLLVDCWLTEIAVRDLCLFLCVIGEDSSPNWQLPDHRRSSDSCRYTWRCIQRIHSSNLHFWALTKARTSILHESFVDDASNLLLSLNLHNPFHLWTVFLNQLEKVTHAQKSSVFQSGLKTDSRSILHLKKSRVTQPKFSSLPLRDFLKIGKHRTWPHILINFLNCNNKRKEKEMHSSVSEIDAG